MLNISASSIPNTTARSSSFDLSEFNGSPRSKIAKNSRRALSIFSVNETRPSWTMMSKEDLQARLTFMIAEVDRLTKANAQLLAENDNWKMRFRGSVGKNAISSGQKGLRTGGDLPNETFEIAPGPHEVEAWKEKYINMERSYRNEIESLKSRLHVSLLESAQKKNGTEMTPKAKGDFNGTPRFAKEKVRPLIFESPHSKGEDNVQAILKARIEEMYMENKTLVSQIEYYKRNWEVQKKDIETLRKQIAELIPQKGVTEERETSINQDELAEMCEPIYMKALLFEDAVEQYEEKSCAAAVVEAVKGDDALSMSESFTEEKLLETEKLREEVRKLQKDISRYEGIVSVLSRKAQEGIRLKNEKENIEKELILYKQKIIDSEKQLRHGSPFIQQDHAASVIRDAENKVIALQQKEEKLKLEITRLNNLAQEQEQMSKAYAKENERILTSTAAEIGKLQGRVLELEGTIQRLNAEIDVWKDEYGKLDSRRKREKREVSDSSKIELQLRFDKSEKRIVELTKENSDLNELLRMRALEIEELKGGYRTSIKSYQEEVNQKWVRSCTQMEEIVLCLEARKDNMQAQLERMKAILEANTQELEELYEQNEEKAQENMALLEEVKRLKQMSLL